MKELSSFLRTTPKKIYRLTEEGEIKSFKVGRTTLFLKSDILEMIGARKVEEIQKEPSKTYGVEQSDGSVAYDVQEASTFRHGDYSQKMELWR